MPATGCYLWPLWSLLLNSDCGLQLPEALCTIVTQFLEINLFPFQGPQCVTRFCVPKEQNLFFSRWKRLTWMNILTGKTLCERVLRDEFCFEAGFLQNDLVAWSDSNCFHPRWLLLRDGDVVFSRVMSKNEEFRKVEALSPFLYASYLERVTHSSYSNTEVNLWDIRCSEEKIGSLDIDHVCDLQRKGTNELMLTLDERDAAVPLYEVQLYDIRNMERGPCAKNCFSPKSFNLATLGSDVVVVAKNNSFCFWNTLTNEEVVHDRTNGVRDTRRVMETLSLGKTSFLTLERDFNARKNTNVYSLLLWEWCKEKKLQHRRLKTWNFDISSYSYFKLKTSRHPNSLGLQQAVLQVSTLTGEDHWYSIE